MKKFESVLGMLVLVLVLVLVAAAAPVMASTPVGIYGAIEKVVLEPAEGQPNRIQVWGAFSIIKERSSSFHDPARGYLYFTLKAGEEAAQRKEWADMKALAGSGKIVAFGNRWEQKVSLRKTDEKPKDPDVYTISTGLMKVSKDTEYSPIRNLAKLISVLSPADGEEVEPGKVTLLAREIETKEHPDVKARFEIEDASGDVEASPAVVPIGGQAEWTPKMKVDSGKKYKWRVWAVDGDWKGPIKTSELKGKAAAKAGAEKA